jgi:hypothetical protein
MNNSRLRIFVVILILGVLFVQIEHEASAICDWSGTWSTNLGWTITFAQSGFNVEGSFSPRGGEIEGLRLSANLEGGWGHLPDYAPPNHSGSFNINISANCNSFTGQYRKGYAQHGNAWLPFSGTRASGGTISPPSTPPPPGHGHDDDNLWDLIISDLEGGLEVNNQAMNHGSDFRVPCNHSRFGCEAEMEAREKARAKAFIKCAERVIEIFEIALNIDLSVLDEDPGRQVDFGEGIRTVVVVELASAFAAKTCGSLAGSASLDSVDAMQVASYDISMDLNQGSMRVKRNSQSANMIVSTSPARVIPQANSDVSVVFDSTNFKTYVAVHNGNARVESGGSPVNLSGGQMIRVEPDGTPGPIETIGSSPAPPSNRTIARSGSSLKDFDTNGNGVLDESEFFAMVDAWLAETISNELFFTGVDFWISQAQITSASLNSHVDILSGVQASFESGRDVLFRAQGQEISRVQTEIYDSGGELVYAGQAMGTKLSWRPQVANAVYLYRVIAFDKDGRAESSQIKKLTILN